jgi:hypothetical protein
LSVQGIFRAPLPLGVLCALLVGVLGAPDEARAGCGDYVVIGAGPMAGQHHMGHAGAMSSDRFHSEPNRGLHQGGQRRSRCPGGMCSRHLPAPLVPPPQSPTVDSEHWGALEGLALASEPGAAPLGWESPRVAPVSQTLSIYRPPR